MLRYALLALLTVVSGIADAQGFTQAARVWDGGTFHGDALLKSAAGFAIGISLYYVIVRELYALGVRAPEVQTLAWFGVTLIGVAVFSGNILQWRRADQLVAALVLAGIGWLMARTSEG